MITRGAIGVCSHCVGHNLAYRVGLVSECEFILIFNNSRAGEDTVCSEASRFSSVIALLLCHAFALIRFS